MEKYLYLKNAPIHEAIIDIRVGLPPEFDSKVFLKEKNEMEKMGYPKTEQCWELTAGITFNQEKSSLSHDRVPKGYWFTTENRTSIVQFRKDGFTFNKLKPYTSWGEIEKAAKAAWEVYKKLIGAPQIIRVAVRYINHIELPLPLRNISNYFLITPEVSGRGNRPIKGFMQRTAIDEVEIDGESVVTFASQQGSAEGLIKILLDIDVYKNIADMTLDEPEIWKTLNNCRNIKNRIFFNSVTTATLEKYK